MERVKAQSSMILLIVIIAVFAVLVVFLLNIAKIVSQKGFTNLYVNNLLLSVMRTDTGHTDPKCKLVSDLVFCAYFTPEWECGEEGKCLNIANETIAEYMRIFGNETKSMRYLFTVKPTFAALGPEGEQISLDFGDGSLKKAKERVVSHPLVLSKTVGTNQYTLKIQLIVANK